MNFKPKMFFNQPPTLINEFRCKPSLVNIKTTCENLETALSLTKFLSCLNTIFPPGSSTKIDEFSNSTQCGQSEFIPFLIETKKDSPQFEVTEQCGKTKDDSSYTFVQRCKHIILKHACRYKLANIRDRSLMIFVVVVWVGLAVLVIVYVMKLCTLCCRKNNAPPKITLVNDSFQARSFPNLPSFMNSNNHLLNSSQNIALINSPNSSYRNYDNETWDKNTKLRLYSNQIDGNKTGVPVEANHKEARLPSYNANTSTFKPDGAEQQVATDAHDVDSFPGSSGFGGSTCERVDYQAAKNNYFNGLSNRANNACPNIVEEAPIYSESDDRKGNVTMTLI